MRWRASVLCWPWHPFVDRCAGDKGSHYVRALQLGSMCIAWEKVLAGRMSVRCSTQFLESHGYEDLGTIAPWYVAAWVLSACRGQYLRLRWAR
jgi:hypothetical protein